jgi:hypothetical protein
MGKIHELIKSRDVNGLLDLIEAGEYVNELNEWNQSPVRIAALTYVEDYIAIRNPEIIRILLTHPLTRKTIDVKSLIWSGMENDDVDMFNLFYFFGGDIHFKRSDGESLLTIAAKHGYKKIGVHLINLGADLEYAKKYLEDKVMEVRKAIDESQDDCNIVPDWDENDYMRARKWLNNLNIIIKSHTNNIKNNSVIKI